MLGLGLGCILSKVKHVTDSMVEAASLGLAGSLTPEEKDLGLVYPQIERIRDISAEIARSVIRAAQKEVCSLQPLLLKTGVDIGRLIFQGVDRAAELKVMDDEALLRYVKSRMWNP